MAIGTHLKPSGILSNVRGVEKLEMALHHFKSKVQRENIINEIKRLAYRKRALPNVQSQETKRAS